MLGFNGSGKSSTFKCITNEVFSDEGNITIFGRELSSDFDIIRRNMGYCPQTHALFDHLTVQETFEFYIHLKKSHHDIDVKQLLQKFGLEKFRNTITSNLSGGNKRKLNFAIALMNHPKLILLDEPSTGVDPESRRIMWKNINDIPNYVKNYNMLLSTHSMEEAEILCDTIGWMKAGNFIVIGNPEKLKLQFSQGYHLQLRYRSISSESESMFEYKDLSDASFQNMFPNLHNSLNVTVNNFSAQLGDNRKTNEIIYYLSKLDITVGDIKGHCNKISLVQSESGTFELLVNVDPNLQGDLFKVILHLKVTIYIICR